MDPEQLRAILDQVRNNPELRAALEKELGSSVTATYSVVATDGGTAAGQIAVGNDVHGNIIYLSSGVGPMAAEQVLRWLGKKRAPEELKEITDRYLRHLVERYQYLDFRGLGLSDRIPLRLPLLEMYVPLKARVETPKGETWERVRLAGREAAPEEVEAMGRTAGQAQPVLDLLREHGGVILLGDPGAGKSTFLKFLALALATGQGDKLGLGERLPVLVPLAAYAEDLADGDVPLDEFVARYYQKRGVDLPLDAILEPALAKGKVLLLLDGLDEVRDLAHRHLLVERVKDFYAFHKDKGNKLVLTSRIVGYREARPDAPGLAEGTLVDFDDEEIEAFVDKWTAALERAAQGTTKVAELDAAREKTDLLRAVATNPGVRALATNPLLLTILAVMKRQGAELPDRRVALYKTCIETLIRHWNLVRSLTGRAVASRDEAATLKILAPLALWMHEASPGIGLVNEWELERKLESLFGAQGHELPEDAARRFLSDVRESTALLLDKGGKQYGFIHLTFQEYLAGVALAKLGEQEVWPLVDALAAHVDDPAWREVSLLAIGYVGIVQGRDGAASDIVSELVRRSPGQPGAAASLAGLAVADMRAGGVTPVCRQVVVQALVATMRADEVEPRMRAAAGRLLADLGDPRPEVMTVEAMEFCRVLPGPFVLGSEEDELAKSWERPALTVDLPYSYLIGRYPVTVAQFQQFVNEAMLSPGDPDSLRGPGNTPVVWVSWGEALDFCDWLTEKYHEAGLIALDWLVTLPSEPEWEKAARGGLRIPVSPQVAQVDSISPGGQYVENPNPTRHYPWGDKLDTGRANCLFTGVQDVSVVGAFPGGTSPYGCEDMSGNVWEWTRSHWGPDEDEPTFRYPYSALDGREDVSAPPEIFRVLRGGSFVGPFGAARCAVRYKRGPFPRNKTVGFRVVLLPSQP